MEHVSFEEVPVKPVTPILPERGMVGFLLRKGWAKDTHQAQRILLGATVAGFVFTGIVLWATTHRGGEVYIPPEAFEGMDE